MPPSVGDHVEPATVAFLLETDCQPFSTSNQSDIIQIMKGPI
jgi:hypothetical protein